MVARSRRISPCTGLQIRRDRATLQEYKKAHQLTDCVPIKEILREPTMSRLRSRRPFVAEAAQLASLTQTEQQTWEQSWIEGVPPGLDVVTNPTCPQPGFTTETSVRHSKSSAMWPGQMCRISLPMGRDRITCLPLRREPPDHKAHCPRPGAIPASTIPIPAHLFDSDSSHLGYDSDSDSDSNTNFMNDSDSDSDSYSIPTAALLIL